jgi:hypothetical protein
VARPPLAPFLLLTVGLAVAGLVALLLLNTLVAQDSFRLSELQRDNNALAEREQVLVARVSALDAPGGLARRAEKLGMVPAGTPAFLSPSGRTIGKPTKARMPVRPAPKTTKPLATAKKATTPAKPVVGNGAAKPTSGTRTAATAKTSKKKAPAAQPSAPAADQTAPRKATG